MSQSPSAVELDERQAARLLACRSWQVNVSPSEARKLNVSLQSEATHGLAISRTPGEVGPRHGRAHPRGQPPRMCHACSGSTVRSPTSRTPERRIKQLRVKAIFAALSARPADFFQPIAMRGALSRTQILMNHAVITVGHAAPAVTQARLHRSVSAPQEEARTHEGECSSHFNDEGQRNLVSA